MIERAVFFLLTAVLLTALPYETTALLAAAAVHELGHIGMLRCLGGRIDSFRFEGRGFCLCFREPNELWSSVLIAFAGPLAGLVFAQLLMLLHMKTGWSWLRLCAGCSALLSVFNLLPAHPLDGGQILEPLAAALWGGKRAEQILRISGWLCFGLLFTAGLLLALRGYGFALLAAALFLLPEQARRHCSH